MNNISEEDKLSWGNVDFIEESVSFCNSPLNFEDTGNTELSISESENKKSPFRIIGKVSGCIAPIGQMSRNGRLYLESHWPKILSNPNLQERIAQRKFFGMISHENKRIDDRNFKAGEISHICSLLEVRNDDNGKPFLYGELDILNTPAGRILKAMYEGGAGLYVSTRAAGKLLESKDGKPYKIVDSGSYYVDSIDFVLNPGFLQAKPVYEGVVENLQEGKLEDIEKEAGKTFKEAIKADTEGRKEEADKLMNKYKELADERGKERIKQGKSDPVNDAIHKADESEEIQLLKSQIDKLAKIVEKVVDDVYEQPEAEQSVEEQLGDLLNNSSVTDEAYEDVVAILQNAKPELLNKIMENSRGRFNDEHAEKSGLKIDYYRFGGNKPYKIVPKDKSYFEASWDSPRYRTLKQAQKHVLDSYNKPKETNEALGEAVSLLIDSNLSKTVLEDIIDILIKAKKQQ